MALPHVTPHRVAPYLLSGASEVYILVRLWRLNRRVANNEPAHSFLFKNTDVILALTGIPVVWHIAHRKKQPRTRAHNPDTRKAAQPVIGQVVHQLRQVFTGLLLGLGLIKRKAYNRESIDIPRLVDRLQNLVAQGIQAVNKLDSPPYHQGWM
jgi:hypothetical protein